MFIPHSRIIMNEQDNRESHRINDLVIAARVEDLVIPYRCCEPLDEGRLEAVGREPRWVSSCLRSLTNVAGVYDGVIINSY